MQKRHEIKEESPPPPDENPIPKPLFSPIVAVLESDVHAPEDGEISFEQYMEPLLLEYSRAVLQVQEENSSNDIVG